MLGFLPVYAATILLETTQKKVKRKSLKTLVLYCIIAFFSVSNVRKIMCAEEYVLLQCKL